MQEQCVTANVIEKGNPFWCLAAEIGRNSRLTLRAQPVDATPSNQFIRQYFL
jgi:hypothetical protein